MLEFRIFSASRTSSILTKSFTVAYNNVEKRETVTRVRLTIMDAICVGDLRSLFKSNYVDRLTRSQVVAFQIPKSVATPGVPGAREMSWERNTFAYGIELFHSGTTTPSGIACLKNIDRKNEVRKIERRVLECHVLIISTLHLKKENKMT